MIATRVVIALALLALFPGTAHANFRHHWHFHSWLMPHDPGTVAAGDGANYTAFDFATHTLYIANYNTDTVSVIDMTRCNARRSDGCAASAPSFQVGSGPVGEVFDARTRTLYVAVEGEHAVAVVDTTRCNAGDTSGCGAQTRVTVDGGPFGLVLDPVSNTVYVGNSGTDSLALIDAGTCNRIVKTSCGAAPALAASGQFPLFPALDPAAHTLYTPNNDDSHSVSVVDTRTCNARTPARCPAAPPLLHGGDLLSNAAVDDGTHTLYVTDQNTGTVFLFDAATCNASVLSGCGQTPASTRVGPVPFSNLVVDRPTHTLYVPNADGDTVSVIDTTHCRSGEASGCGRRWPTLQAGAFPIWIDEDPATGTLYVPNFTGDDVTVLDPTACNAVRRSGCRDEARAVLAGSINRVAVDPDSHTAYVTGDNQLALLDTRACPRACTAVIVPFAGRGREFALDRARHTLYISDPANGNVAVLDADRCRADHPAGCTVLARMAAGPGPAGMSLNLQSRYERK